MKKLLGISALLIGSAATLLMPASAQARVHFYTYTVPYNTYYYSYPAPSYTYYGYPTYTYRDPYYYGQTYVAPPYGYRSYYMDQRRSDHAYRKQMERLRRERERELRHNRGWWR